MKFVIVRLLDFFLEIRCLKDLFIFFRWKIWEKVFEVRGVFYLEFLFWGYVNYVVIEFLCLKGFFDLFKFVLLFF